MPAEITSFTSGEEIKTETTLVFPDHVAGIAIYDPEEDADGVVVVLCDKQDSSSDIYLFPIPDDFVRQPDPEALMVHCDEDTFIAQIEDGEECHIKTGSREGNLIEFVISHSLLMSRN